jgi:hypothetical protein
MVHRAVPFVPEIKRGKDESKQAAEQLNTLIRRLEGEGWEFCHLEDVTTLRNNGCLAGLTGNPYTVITIQVAVFSRVEKRTEEAVPQDAPSSAGSVATP